MHRTQIKIRQAVRTTADRTSGGHGARTRNPLRGTTFPVWPLTIRLPSETVREISFQKQAEGHKGAWDWGRGEWTSRLASF